MHNDYPLPPEKLETSPQYAVKNYSSIPNKCDIKIGDADQLVPNLGSKSKYVLHYKNRHLYLSLGMKLVSVHRILLFKQSNWLKKYIDFNTDKRKMLSIALKKIV